MLKLQWQILSRIGTISLALYIAWQAWDYLGPRKPEIGPVRKQVADQLIPAIVEDLRTSRQSIRSAVLLHLTNDTTDYVSDQLRLGIEQAGILDLHDRTLSEKVRTALRLKHPSYGRTDEAIAAGRSRNAPAVVFGTIHSFESYPDGAKIDLEIRLADVAKGQTIFDRRYSKDVTTSVFSGSVVKEHVGRVGAAQRFLGWVVLVLLLPVFTIGFIRAMVRKDSNRANAFALAVYTAVDAVLAYLLVGADFSSWLSILIFLIAVGVAFGYNVTVMSFAMKLETT